MVSQESAKSNTVNGGRQISEVLSKSERNDANNLVSVAGEASVARDRQVLIFVHIPKTAGSTLNSIIVREYSPLQLAAVDGRFWRWAFHRMTQWTPQRLNRSDVFTGHMPYGLHQLMVREATYMTVLRDPVERIISEYFYRIGRGSHPLVDRELRGLSLSQYVEKLPYNNVQTKLLAGGSPGYDYTAGECSPAMLETAKRNLAQKFSLVGLTERFDETLALCKIIFGWNVKRYAIQRMTPGKPRQKAIPPDLRNLIAERNCYDVELYKYGTQLFEQILGKHRERLPQMLDEVRKARLPQGSKTRAYTMMSYLRKVAVRVRSDV
jgi:hypothetical protein